MHWYSLRFIDVHWYSVIVSYIHWSSVIFIDIHWYSLIFIYIHWYALIFNDIHCYSLIFIDDVHRYVLIFIDLRLHSFSRILFRQLPHDIPIRTTHASILTETLARVTLAPSWPIYHKLTFSLIFIDIPGYSFIFIYI